MRLWKSSLLLFVGIATVIIGVFAINIISVDDVLPVFGIDSVPVGETDNSEYHIYPTQTS